MWSRAPQGGKALAKNGKLFFETRKSYSKDKPEINNSLLDQDKVSVYALSFRRKQHPQYRKITSRAYITFYLKRTMVKGKQPGMSGNRAKYLNFKRK